MKEIEGLKAIISNLKYNKVIDQIEFSTIDRMLDDIAEQLKNCNLQNVTARFSLVEIENVMRKAKNAIMKPNLKQILQSSTGESYDSAEDKAFLDKYTGKEVNVYEWAGDWWICEDDNYVITEDCFTVL